MQRVPERLFEDADSWAKQAKQKLDKFEENLDKPNFINYDLLEQKESGSQDIINFGEQLVIELDEHKDISMSRVAAHIKQLAINFNHETIQRLNEVVDCEIVDGVEIDQTELASMEEMMREASSEPQTNPVPMSIVHASRPSTSALADAQPIGRASLAVLTGDENDLLSESPVFSKAKPIGAERSAAEVMVNPSRLSLDLKDTAEEPLDEHLVNEINDYLTGIMEDQANMIEMSDSPIKSQGAECVAAAINFCESVTSVRLANCEIRDLGAQKLFGELAKSKSVEVVDLSGNPLTERCFDAIESCLAVNSKIRQVQLSNIQVKSNFAWQKLKKFGNIVNH